jgi:microcystin-dependent protein
MEGYLGSICIFAGNYPPPGWAFCNGQMLDVQNYQALFSLLSYTYGGSGANFGLPDLCGRAPVGTGTATTTTPAYTEAQKAGSDTITLTVANMPPHTHNGTLDLSLGCDTSDTGTSTPQDNYPTTYMSAYSQQASAAMPPPAITDISVGNAGEGDEISARSPYLAINFIICIQGYYPSQP